MERTNGHAIKGIALAASLMMLASIISLNVSSVAAAPPSSLWVNEDPILENRSDAVMVTDENGVVYIFGGINSTVQYPVNTSTTYNLSTGVTEELTDMPKGVAGAAGAIGPNGDIYVFGGWDTTTHITGDSQVYDPVGGYWYSVASIPSPVAWAKAVTYNGLIYVFGGFAGGASHNMLQIYDPAGNSWSNGAVIPASRCSGGLVLADEYICYIGGSDSSMAATDTVFRYDPDSDSWSTVASLPSPKAANAAVLGPDGFIYSLGGGSNGYSYDNDGSNSLYYYNPGTDEWHIGSQLLYNIRNAGAAVTNEGCIFVLGGHDANVVKSVSSLRVMSTSATISDCTLAPGESATVTVTTWFRYATPESFTLVPVLKNSTGGPFAISYTSQLFAYTSPFAFTITVPESAALETHYLEFYIYRVSYTSISVDIHQPDLALTVVAGANVSGQVDELQDQVVALYSQLTSLYGQMNTTNTITQAELDALMAKLNASESSMAQLTISGSATQEQIDALTAEVGNLKTQLEAISNNLNTTTDNSQQEIDNVQTSLDNKADNALSYLIILLLVVVIALMVLMLVVGRKKK